MAKMVHARLDDESHELLRRLQRRTGLAESEIVRRGLKALAARKPPEKGAQVIGVGKFASRRWDLGSNKRRLAGFGRK